MPDIYAKALSKMVERGATPKQAVSKLRGHLQARGRENLLPRIPRALVRIAARERAKDSVALSVARREDAAMAKRGTKDILKELDVNFDDIDVRIDDSLIGGWRLEGRGHLIDASFKKSLLSIYNRSTQ